MTETDSNNILARAREVLDIEIDGLQMLRDELGSPFTALVQKCLAILRGNGKLVLTGVGKSAHISRKIAATLSSTGSRAVFVHPVEAMHGDLGILAGNDLLLAVSYSGETDELLAVLPSVHRMGVDIVAITGKMDSRLASVADLVVPMPVPREACPFNLAPTTTTTALVALGDALALVLLDCHHFSLSDYALLHPAGAIGRSITLKVKDIMRTGEQLPVVHPGATVKDGLLTMTNSRSGAVAITDENNLLLGIFTDGDFRRRLIQNPEVLQVPIETVMVRNPITISQDSMAVDIMKLLEKRKIDDILAVDAEGHLAGLVDIQDLPKFKVM
ncbi:MAG: KpsF/GutQ family sugar-phosphate isomerase [Victivallales bacterium]|nr:KpsF/GutQ family sugar-phosphate isomerase [Victivallales bacterium]